MATEPSAVEQAVSRTLRENLESIQRTSDELHRAVGDLVAACASTRSLNALPPMVRAQMASASLSATLDVLARLITAAIQPGNRAPMEAESYRTPFIPTSEPLTASNPPESRFAEPKFTQPRQLEPVVQVSAPVSVPVQSVAQPEIAPPSPVITQPPAIMAALPVVAETVMPPSPAPPPAVKVPIVEESVVREPVMQAPVAPPPVVPVPVVQAAKPSAVEAVIELMVEAVQNSGGLHAAHEAVVAKVEPVQAAAQEIIAVPAAPPPLMEPIVPTMMEPVAVAQGSEDDSLWEPGPEVNADFTPAALPEAEIIPVNGSGESAPAAPAFDISSLPVDQQELHRRANRVAKVSMQDIKMLRPDDVRLGRENRDLCFRLRDDIEKAHKEYDRRFQTISSHPVDYFYNWMVEILGGGKSEALGDYPYPSAVLRR